eukprot:6863566-Heterocapsa_arctica.AAC.1
MRSGSAGDAPTPSRDEGNGGHVPLSDRRDLFPLPMVTVTAKGGARRRHEQQQQSRRRRNDTDVNDALAALN